MVTRNNTINNDMYGNTVRNITFKNIHRWLFLNH